MMKILAILSLIAGLVFSVLVFTGTMTMDQYQTAFNVISLLWFLTAPLWLVPELFGKKSGGSAD
jgi:hypothetical protein